MSIAISGQYVFRRSIRKGTVLGGSRLVGMIYPDTTQRRVFAPALGESFSQEELFEISELVKNSAFSRLGRKRRTLKRG